VLTVSDTGEGIPDEVAERIYEPYVSTKDRHEGIGLYVARSVVESTNGTIRHEGLPDGGSRFTLSLPLAS
jgi:signal transduction histidine kinase